MSGEIKSCPACDGSGIIEVKSQRNNFTDVCNSVTQLSDRIDAVRRGWCSELQHILLGLQ